jgi:hypothetical protein
MLWCANEKVDRKIKKIPSCQKMFTTSAEVASLGKKMQFLFSQSALQATGRLRLWVGAC